MRDGHRNTWHLVAAVSGAAAVGMGAIGAHAFKPQNPMYKEVFQRGSDYHLLHTALIAIAPITRSPNIVSQVDVA